MFERFLNSGTYTYFHVHACVPCCFSCVRFFSTPWAIAWQTRLSMGFTREEYWSGLPCPPPEDLSDPGMEPASPASPALQEDSLPTEPPGKPNICSEVKCESENCSVVSDLWPHGYTVHGILQARILEWVAFPFSRESSQPRIEHRSPALQVDSLLAEPQGKPNICSNTLLVYLFFCFRLTSLCITVSMFIHLTTTDADSFFMGNIPLYTHTHTHTSISICYIFFIYSSVDGYLGCFYVLATTVLQWILGYMYLLELRFSQGICPVVGLLGHMVDLFIVF